MCTGLSKLLCRHCYWVTGELKTLVIKMKRAFKAGDKDGIGNIFREFKVRIRVCKWLFMLQYRIYDIVNRNI